MCKEKVDGLVSPQCHKAPVVPKDPNPVGSLELNLSKIIGRVSTHGSKGFVTSGLQRLQKSPLLLLASQQALAQVSQADCGWLGGDVESPGSVVGLLSTVSTCMSWQNGPCGLAPLSAEYFGWIRELVRLLWHGNCL